MPVYEASYRPWDGHGGKRASAKMAIAGTMIRRCMRSRMVKFLILGIPAGACILSSLVFYFGHEALMARVREQLGWNDLNLLFFANRFFLQAAIPFAVLLAALTGSPLIAEDRKARALPLYFSRPITHFDYVLGKMAAVAFFLAALLLLPPVLMYVVDSGLAKEESPYADRLPHLLKSLIVPGVAVVLLSSLSLGASALCRRPPYAGLLLLGATMMVFGVSEILAHGIFRDNVWLAIAPGTSLQRIAQDLMPVPKGIGINTIRGLDEVPVVAAWSSLASWTALGVLVIILKVRRAEVVS